MKKFSRAEFQELEMLQIAAKLLSERRRQLHKIEDQKMDADKKQSRMDSNVLEQIRIAKKALRLSTRK